MLLKYVLNGKYYQNKTLKYNETIKRDEISLNVSLALNEAQGAVFWGLCCENKADLSVVLGGFHSVCI